MVQFESNWKRGKRGIAAAANDDQAHALVKVPLITARYAGTGTSRLLQCFFPPVSSGVSRQRCPGCTFVTDTSRKKQRKFHICTYLLISFFFKSRERGKQSTVDAAKFRELRAGVVCFLVFAGQLLERVEAAVRVHQHNDNAVKVAIAAALMLEKVILGSTIEEAIQWASDPGYLHVDSHTRGLLQQALSMKQTQASEVAKKLGSSCHLPGSFQVSIVHCTA